MSSRPLSRSMPSSLGLGTLATVALCLMVLASSWLTLVNTHVPNPYLDEVFHYGQARQYLQNRFSSWDSKITTPPGLYLISYVHIRLSLLLHGSGTITVAWLRYLNYHIGTLFLPYLIGELLMLLADKLDRRPESTTVQAKTERGWSVLTLGHATLNVCLFPPLFFFYALYYTDVASTLSVLYVYQHYLKKQRISLLFAGIVSLWFRQTNIFWIAILMGGLDLTRSLDKGRAGIEYPAVPNLTNVIHGSWRHGCIYDGLVSQAHFSGLKAQFPLLLPLKNGFPDYVKSIVSIAVAAISSPWKVMGILWPYLSLLTAFGAFVGWNGGVVLGDKNNHVASIHVAQMLYIWPYILFFSFPLLWPWILRFVPRQLVPQQLKYRATTNTLATLLLTVGFTTAMLTIVHYNTIVHPFTLADNRHYMFYVFRILLRHWSVKYMAVPIYFCSAWTAVIALGGPIGTQYFNSQKGIDGRDSRARRRFLKTENGSALTVLTPRGNNVTFVLVWLLSTTLSLVTAPLVEPRYSILPWVFWRLHMICPQPVTVLERKSRGAVVGTKLSVNAARDYRLWAETIWFLLINAFTGYMFLYKGFEWPQEPGKVQRFMW